ncbi:TMEM175 family protein [Streptomyces sp. I6]|uniref:TMEM175 family protein n=1 Tax=Streptomyces sp. I6 TaxID=2483113 RepID=UPI002880A705|nr:TMEM175 family protein [Streptomyces sp. I6]
MSTPTHGDEDESAGAIIGPDRLLAFGDAVFAIAITLLALDITVPADLEARDLGRALHRALSDIGAYLLSFVVIGVLWISQHTLFHRVAGLDSALLHLYLALLAVIAALPFPTRLISEYADTSAATAVYSGSIALASGLLAAMSLRLLLRPELATRARSPAGCASPCTRGWSWCSSSPPRCRWPSLRPQPRSSGGWPRSPRVPGCPGGPGRRCPGGPGRARPGPEACASRRAPHGSWTWARGVAAFLREGDGEPAADVPPARPVLRRATRKAPVRAPGGRAPPLRL